MFVYNYLSLIPLFSSFYKTNEYFVSVMMTTITYVIILIFFGHLLMAFNRFYLLWFPLFYHKIWKSQWYIILLLLIPFLNVCWRIVEPALFVYITEDIVKLTYNDKSVASLYFLMTTIAFLSTTFFAAIFNGFSVIKFCFYKKTLNLNEKNLFCKFKQKPLSADNELLLARSH